MRLFFALWPGAAAQERLEGEARMMASEFGGKPVPADKIHLTLAFLGELTPEQGVEAFGLAKPFTSFRMRLDRWGGFRRSKVGWAGCSRVPPRLVELQSALEMGLREAGFTLEERPFAPHVTLVRKLERPVAARAMAAVQWPARSLALVMTEPGSGKYTTLAETAAEG